MLIMFSFSYAQEENKELKGILPEVGKPEDTFTEWQKITATMKDGSTVTYEYRIAFGGKSALACNYEIEVKNTSAMALSFAIDFHYYDKLVKGNFGGLIGDKVKPGKVFSGKMVQQGCKKEKGVEKSDLEHCLACDFYYYISVLPVKK